jgi:putative transposase
MSRLRRIVQSDRYFFITTNLGREISPLTPAERTAVLHVLDTERRRNKFYLFAHVVLPTHLYLLFEPGECGLTANLRDFKSKSALLLAKRRNHRDPIWQSRFFDVICRRTRDFRERVDYIHQNPVEAGFVRQAEDYPWSSAARCSCRDAPPIRLDEVNLPADRNALLWPAPWS